MEPSASPATTCGRPTTSATSTPRRASPGTRGAPRPNVPEVNRAALAAIDPRLARDRQGAPSAGVNELWGDGGADRPRWTPEQVQAHREQMQQLQGQMEDQMQKLNDAFASGTPE